MDFRNKTPQFRKKVRDIYGELNSFYNDKKGKIRLTKRINFKITKEKMEKFKFLEKKLESPVKALKQQANINYLIEDTKRNCLGYRTFLESNSSINLIPEPITYKYRNSNKKNKNYNTFNNLIVNEKQKENISKNLSKVDTLKKEIMSELENENDNIRKKYYLTNSSFFSSSKSYKNLNYRHSIY